MDFTTPGSSLCVASPRGLTTCPLAPPPAFCSQSPRTRTHTAPQSELNMSTYLLLDPLVPMRGCRRGEQCFARDGEGRPVVELAQDMASSPGHGQQQALLRKSPEENVTVSWDDSKASFSLKDQLWLLCSSRRAPKLVDKREEPRLRLIHQARVLPS